MSLFRSFCSGLVLDLISHKNEYASKYLASKGYYVLVEKRTVPAPNESVLSQEVQYVPLLLRPNETFHGYEARVAEKRPGQERSATSRNTASRGKKGKLRPRKSIMETTWPVKQSRLWRTFPNSRLCSEVTGAIVDSFKRFSNFDLHGLYVFSWPPPCCYVTLLFPAFESDWYIVEFLWKSFCRWSGVNTLPKASDKDEFWSLPRTKHSECC